MNDKQRFPVILLKLLDLSLVVFVFGLSTINDR